MNFYHSTEIEESSRPRKRAKVKLACRECRNSKIRCNGARPLCDSCDRRKIPSRRCIYTADATASQPRSNNDAHIIALEERLQQLEAAQTSSNRSQHIDIQDAPMTSPLGLPNSLRERRSPHGRPGSSGTTDLQSDGLSVSHRNNSDNSPYLGKSSAVGFMEEAYQSLNPTKKDASVSSERPLSTVSSWFTDHEGSQDIEFPTTELWLPPRSVADDLLDNYFEYVHPEFPIFLKPTFIKRYERLWLSKKETERLQQNSINDDYDAAYSQQLFNLMLYLVFALGYALTPPTARKHSASETQENVQKLVKAIPLEVLTIPSFQRLQTLLLLARVYQHRGFTNRCWAIAGLAIRMAQGLGLDRTQQGRTQAQKEERRRVWWCCVLLDRTQSMTYGRPLILPKAIRLAPPEMIDDEYLATKLAQQDGSQPPERMPKVGYFVHAIKSMEIYAGILLAFYQPAIEDSPERDQLNYADLHKFDADVDRFCSNIPPYLKYEPSSPLDREEYFARQATLLYYRVLNIRIMLFRRPLIQLARQKTAQTALQRYFARGCIETCSSSAEDLIELVNKHLYTSWVPPAWFTTFLLYNAGIVLVVLLNVTAWRGHLSEDRWLSLELARVKCLNILKEYHARGVSMANKCVETLLDAHSHAQENMHHDKMHETFSTQDPQVATNQTTGVQDTSDILSTNSLGLQEGSDGQDSNLLEPQWTEQDMDWLSGLTDLDDFGTGMGFGEQSLLPDV